jgi:hypothetical protein
VSEDWTVDALREHLGEYITTARWCTPAEVACYGGQEMAGGGGVLVDVAAGKAAWRYGDLEEDFGVVPWVVVDYGMGWAITPGTKVAFGQAPEQDARLLLGPKPAVTP